MDAPTELVAQFLPVELKQDPSAERSVVDVSQDVQRLDDAPQFRQGLGQGRWAVFDLQHAHDARSEEHTSELQSLMRISYAVFCLKKKNQQITYHYNITM